MQKTNHARIVVKLELIILNPLRNKPFARSGHKHGTKNNKQQTTNNKQRTTNNKQQTTNNKQRTTNNLNYATKSKIRINSDEHPPHRRAGNHRRN